MESYVEITFMHNLLISAFSLTSSLAAFPKTDESFSFLEDSFDGDDIAKLSVL